jgi:hypothetical protein
MAAHRYCSACGLGIGEWMACEEPDCGQLLTTRELKAMAKRQTREPAHDERNPPHDETSAPDQTASGYNPFLKPEHVNAQGKTRLELTGWTRRTVGKYGPQVVIEVRDDADRTWDFGIKVGSPNHRMMFRGFGRNESDWEGAIVVEVQTFKLQGGKRMSNPGIAIVECDPTNPPF